MEVIDHERASQRRYEDLKKTIEDGKDEKMSTTENFYGNPMAGTGAAGGGLGGGAIGGFLGAALGNGGLGGFGNRGGEGFVTPTQLQTAMTGVVDANNAANVQEALGDIKGMIPAAEGQVQLALAQAAGQLSNQLGQQTLTLVGGQANINDNISRSTAGVIAVGETIKDTVNTTSAATQLGIANLATSGLQNTFALSQAIANDGDKTRAMLVAQNEATLQRQLAVAESALLEARMENRARASEINITNTNTASAQQAQFQNQMQAQAQAIIGLTHLVSNLQNAVATNSQMIIGNSGAVAAGPQTANPINVRT